MKFWSIKYWATKGIEENDDWQATAVRRDMFRRIPRPRALPIYGYLGRDLFETEAEAAAAMEAKRVKKIESLRKQIEKLEGMNSTAGSGGGG